jgi:hypothetical protein
MSVIERIPTESDFDLLRGNVLSLNIGETPGQTANVTAEATCYTATHESGHRLDLLSIRAENLERWIEARRIESPSPWVRNLDGRLRLTIGRASSGEHWCELRQAQPKGAGWSNLFGASLEELDRGASVSVARELRVAGARDIGTRATVLGEEGRRRSSLCVLFDWENEAVAVLAFLLTRVLPLSRL